MLRILFIKKGKNTKTNNFKAANIKKIIFKITKLRGELPTLKLFQISNQQ